MRDACDRRALLAAGMLVTAPVLYRAVVAGQVRLLFDRLNHGDWRAVNDGLAAEFTYTFHGATALGGTRRRRATMEAWWQRLFRLLPTARFEVLDILVAGPPWRTRVAVDAAIRGELADGTRYENVFKQKAVLRFGKVVSVDTVEDTGRLERALKDLADHGFAEAAAPPLTD